MWELFLIIKLFYKKKYFIVEKEEVGKIEFLVRLFFIVRRLFYF